MTRSRQTADVLVAALIAMSGLTELGDQVTIIQAFHGFVSLGGGPRRTAADAGQRGRSCAPHRPSLRRRRLQLLTRGRAIVGGGTDRTFARRS